MSPSTSLSEKIRRGEPIPWYLDLALSATSPLYRVGMLLRGLSTPVKVNARVIKDKRLANLDLPFDMKRMTYGGFKVLAES